MLADHELNQASWDQLAAIHGQDSYYDTDALSAGASSLIAEEEAALLEALPRVRVFTPLQPSTLTDVAARLGVTSMQVALSWLLRRAQHPPYPRPTHSTKARETHYFGDTVFLPKSSVTRRTLTVRHMRPAVRNSRNAVAAV